MSEQLFIMEGEGQVSIYNGNYSEYRTSLELEKEKIKEAPKSTAPTPEKKENSQKLTYKEQRELEELEQTIALTEEKINTLTASLNNFQSADYLGIQGVTKDIETLNSSMERTMERWVELSEKNN